MNKDWASAAQYCHDHGALLVVIDSKEEQDALRLELIKQSRGEHKSIKLNTALLTVAFSALTLLVGRQEEHVAC